MPQIAKCNDQSCCKFRTNYLTYFLERFLPPPVLLKSTVDGLEISEAKFGSFFQAIFLVKYADKCFDKFCPSLQKVDKKGKSTIQKRTCWKFGKYHLTIKAMDSHKSDQEDEDEENVEDYIEVEFIGDDETYERLNWTGGERWGWEKPDVRVGEGAGVKWVKILKNLLT